MQYTQAVSTELVGKSVTIDLSFLGQVVELVICY